MNRVFCVLAAVAGTMVVIGRAEAGPPWYPGTAYPIVAQMPDPNPVVYDSGRYVSGVYYGPFRYQVRTNREVVHASAADPCRRYADPGSQRYVDAWGYDACGRPVHERGYAWTSNGVPHSDVNVSRRYRTSRFGSRVDNTHVVKEMDAGDDE